MGISFKDLKKERGVYIITNTINNKHYIGESVNIHKRLNSHKNRKEQVIHKAFVKYGIDNFSVYIEYLPNFSKDDLLNLEEELIKRFNTIAPHGYNISERGSNSKVWLGRKHTEETKRKISNFHKGNTYCLGHKASDERKRKLSLSKMGNTNRLGQKHTEESKIKMSIAQKGKKRSLEDIEKNRLRNLGKTIPQETRDKISKSHKGKKRSRDSVEKGASKIRGLKRTQAQIENIRDSANNRSKVSCPHCNLSLTPQNSTRWHFDKCKFKLL